MSKNEIQPMAPTTENIIKAHNVAKETGADSTCKVLEALYPDVDFNPKDNRPVTERIKTFEDALEALGNHAFVNQYRRITEEQNPAMDESASDLIAYLKLRIIAAALNEGWEPQFEQNECRWYPYFELIRPEDIDGMDDEQKSHVVYLSSSCAKGRIVYSYASFDSAVISAGIGRKIAFKSQELARYAGLQFTEIYANNCFICENPKSLH